ncbi:MAG: hypothetical protein K2M73_10615 [Lachnospiraceae bacterium]|nr:hypothetical protein [Lachnospiraceae bacterium]
MIAYKGFNQNLCCTKGRGTFKYEIGKIYTEKECKTARNGFHCVEEPIRVLDWYEDGRFCIVEIDEDINEKDDKLSATKMTILKELDIIQLITHECLWIQKHPNRQTSNRILQETGISYNTFLVVRGKDPKAAGAKDTTLFLLQEKNNSKDIKRITVIFIDGFQYKPDTYYDINEKEVIANDGKRKIKKLKNA